MKERSNEARLQDMSAPAPDPAARLRAKQAALAEFTRVHAANQETDASPRLSRQATGGRETMKWNLKWLVPRSVFGGFASACVVVMATALLWPIFTNRVPVENGRVVLDPVPTASVGEAPSGTERATPEPAHPGPAGDARPSTVTTVPSHESRVVDSRGTSQERPKLTKDDLAKLEAAMAAQPEPVLADVMPLPELKPVESLVFTNGPEPMATMPASASPSEARVEADEVIVTGSRRVSGGSASSPKNAAAARGRENGLSGVFAQASTPPSAPPPGIVAGRLERKGATGFEAEGDDRFQSFEINPIKLAASEPVSTFSVDVDTASYSFVRRQLNAARLPQKDSVRVEEMVNYFDYAWPQAGKRDLPFEPTIVVSDSPWNKGRKLVHVGIKGYDVPRDKAPDVNLVLLLDVSGSMDSPDKLPLAVQSMELLLSSLKPDDTVGIVVYAGAAGMVLEPTRVADKQKIIGALRELTPGGSTAGAEGIELAYQLAEKHFRKGGVNRILLATDGDFNVGIHNTQELKGFVERKRKNGIMLSVLGFGQGNYRDELAQALAQNGNGVAAYIDTLSEAQKVLVQESSGSLFTIAKDVKIQVEFNPATVAEYRLVGYETRALKREDFNNDAVDAGDVGSGHTVTAIYEIAPADSGATSVDPLRYSSAAAPRVAGSRDEYGFLKIRYKLPGEESSRLMSRPIPLETDRVSALVQREVQFSTAVAGFAQILRGGTHTGSLTFDDVLKQAQAAKGGDEFGYRTEFVQLVRKAKTARGM